MSFNSSASGSVSGAAENLPAASRFIVVEGPIGVGKSSLAIRLSRTFSSSLLLEKSEENPFLERFYKFPRQYALATQLFFLFQRVEQLSDIRQSAASKSGRVADFMMEKDPLFAKLNLDDDEYQLYRQVYQNLDIDRPIPDLVIYLQAPAEILQDRVHRRRIGYEMGMDMTYLSQLSEAYTTYFHHYSETPLLIVNAAEINPVDNDAHYAALVSHINRIDAGKHFFNPLVEAL